ncbi:formyltetrahydrofolate deformylase, partial [Lecanoromycetidae sp. Uapishka_2]
MPSNTAAWLTKSPALEVKSAPYTSPRENEVVIKNGAVAINPVDWVIRDTPGMAFPWIKPPFILGIDVAGEIVELGPGVTHLNVGDRVIGHGAGTDKSRNSAALGAFQLYTVLLARVVTPIPSTLSYESAAVLPLGVSTAACGLFQKDQLGLKLPSPSTPPKSTGKTVIIWGGSTSVGSNAIQLAVAAGYEVITTASPKNFDYVKKLGASEAFDYNSKTVVSDIIRALNGKFVVGALTMGSGAADACFDILSKCKGDKFISMASYPVPQPPPERFATLIIVYCYLTGLGSIWFKSKTRGIRYKFIFGSTLIDNEVGLAIYQDFLPRALAEGTYIAAPDPQVVGKGLEYVQVGLDLQKKGVSAKKVVVSL